MKPLWQLSLLVSLFILWGSCNALNDVLIRAFQTALTLGDAESSLVQTAFYAGYCLGALPAAALARRRGYKVCVCTGLGLVCAGALLFWPCSRGAMPSYTALLGCLYLLAFGLAFLESSANPWIVALAERRRAGSGTRALNLAQSFNPLGAMGGVLLGRQLILGSSSFEMVEAVGLTYLLLGSVFAAVGAGFILTRFPGDEGTEALRAPFRCIAVRSSLRVRGFAAGVAAQFLCIGAQTCVWSFTIKYVRATLPITEQRAADTLLLSLLLFFGGRVGSTAAMHHIAADKLMAAECAAAAVCCIVVATTGGVIGTVALCLISPCMGMLFPTIFGLAIGCLDAELAEVGASLLVMAIVGGALVTPVMGLLSDASGSLPFAFLVPALCFVGIGAFALAHAAGAFGRGAGVAGDGVGCAAAERPGAPLREGMAMAISTGVEPPHQQLQSTCTCAVSGHSPAKP
jgi:MFS transporter, FHS family, L-fucose permease